MAVSYDSDVNISRRGTFPLSFKAWGIAWGYLQVNDLGRLRENQATKSMAKRECKLREWKKVLEVHNSVWYWSRYLTTNSWKCLPGLWCLWWSTGSQITHICTDVTTGASEVFAFMNAHYARKSGNKANFARHYSAKNWLSTDVTAHRKRFSLFSSVSGHSLPFFE